ncbi:MAG: ABC transporter permease [Oscillospiraceae bacterium]|nr:ABC transporter permease [Oscillospiraceae bacterium]
MKHRRLPGRILSVLVFVFLYLPIVVLVVYSFNSTKGRTGWSGFTFDWYAKLFHNSQIMSALSTTLLLSVMAASIAAVAGTIAAIGFYNMRKRPRGFLLAINNLPVINADIVTGVSMMLLFVSAGTILGFSQGFITLLIAHITFNIPYVILSVMPKLYQLDSNLFEAAQDLGASWFQTFLRVIIPEIRPGIVNGLLIAFTMSIDDFIISYFTAGSQVQTLSMTIYSMAKRQVSPEINALSTLLFITVLLLLLIVNVRQRKVTNNR